MTAWGVYLVVASLLATAALIARPIVALTKTNTKLECALEKLTEAMRKFEARMEKLEADNQSSHLRIWEHIDKQDSEMKIYAQAIERHEAEIKNLKGCKKAG